MNMGTERILRKIKNANVLIVSPHIDDAVFSLGGFIAKYQKDWSELTVANVFSNCGWSKDNIPLELINDVRRNEDFEVFSEIENTQLSYLELDDTSVRGLDELTELDASLIDEEIRSKVTLKIDELLSSNEFDMIFFPLGIGNHIDHKVIFDYACSLDSKNIYFYEDMPYTAISSQSKVDNYMQIEGKKMKFEVIDIADKVSDKRSMMMKYRSQISISECESILAYSTRQIDEKRVERVWRFVNEYRNYQ